jgi:Domain of unknown function (DUF4268)
MSLYRVTSNKLEAVPQTTFASENLLERKDLQRLLRTDIGAIGNDLMVIAEEYGEWEDSNRRIDLLCLSKDACLVVIEIKRTNDGGHMELQAIRYAAMVSSMTLDQVIHAYAKMQGGSHDTAKNAILDFLQLNSEDDMELTGEVRIILASADFSTELTTAVMWLNRHDLDITCVRLRPYRINSDVLIDVTQIIPLPESADYEVKVKAQQKEKQKVQGVRQDIFRRFWGQLIDRSKSTTQLLANRSTTSDHWLSAGIGRSGFNLCTSLVQNEGQVECYIRLPGGEEKSTAAFKALLARREEIEQKFGSPLDWQELEGRQGSRICTHLLGGWKSPESEWPEIQDRIINALIRLETALRKPIQEINID